MIGAAELADLRESIEATFDSTLTWHAQGDPVVDDMGGTTPGAATTTADVPCHYRAPQPGAEQQLADRMELVQAVVVLVAWDVDLQVGDVLDLDDGTSVQVEGLVDSATWRLSTLAMTERTGGGG